MTDKMTTKKVKLAVFSSITDLMAAENPSGEEINGILAQLFSENGEKRVSMKELIDRVSLIMNERSTERVEFTTDGSFSDDGERIELSYEESPLNGMEGSVTRLVFDRSDPLLVTMIRTGSSSATLVFNARDRRQQCVYETGVLPAFEVCVCTRDVRNEIASGGSSLELDYIIELRGVSAEYSHVRVEMRDMKEAELFTGGEKREYELP